MRWVVHLGASSVSLQARVNKYRHTKSLALLRDGMAGASAKLFFSFFLSFLLSCQTLACSFCIFASEELDMVAGGSSAQDESARVMRYRRRHTVIPFSAEGVFF